MKKLIKYGLFFLCFTAILFIVVHQFISGILPSIIVSVIIAVVPIFIFSKKINNISISSILLILPFLCLLIVPIIGPKESTSLEKRSLAAFPTFNIEDVWSTFFQFTDYFTDRFAYRNKAVETIGKIKFNVLHVSPVPHLVVIGKEDWLFFTRPDLMTDINTPFTDLEMKKIKLNLEITTKWFDNRNIKYYFALLPFKSRIYSELMPEETQHRFAHSKIEQIFNYIQKDTSIRSIDIRNELLEGKKIRPTYLKTDTHWNLFGAYLGYKKITERMKQDFPQLYVKQLSDYKIDSSIQSSGDLQMMLGFADQIKFPYYYLRDKTNVKPITFDSLSDGIFPEKYCSKRMPQKVNGLKLYVIRDSFTEFLREYLAPSFDTSYYAWQPVIPVAKVMEKSPNIVLHEVMEQFVDNIIELPMEIKSDTSFLKKYFPQYFSLQ